MASAIPPTQPLERPSLMTLGGVFAILYCIGALFLLAWAVAGKEWGPLGSEYSIGGQPVPREEWLALAGPLLAITAVLMAAIAIGIFRARPWSRHVVMLHWLVVTGYGLILWVLRAVDPFIAMRAVGQGVILGAFAAWYFYRKPNVVAYFRSLAGQETTSSAP